MEGAYKWWMGPVRREDLVTRLLPQQNFDLRTCGR